VSLHQRAVQGTLALQALRSTLDPAAQRAFDNAVPAVLTLLYEALHRCERLEEMLEKARVALRAEQEADDGAAR
jgi:hypothetical protein